MCSEASPVPATSVTVLAVQHIPNTCAVQTACRIAWSNSFVPGSKSSSFSSCCGNFSLCSCFGAFCSFGFFLRCSSFALLLFLPLLCLLLSLPQTHTAIITWGRGCAVTYTAKVERTLCFDCSLSAPAADQGPVSRSNSGKCNIFSPIILLLTQGSGPSITWEGCMAIMLTT